jgi:hypothetical protein
VDQTADPAAVRAVTDDDAVCGRVDQHELEVGGRVKVEDEAAAAPLSADVRSTICLSPDGFVMWQPACRN